MGAPAQRPRWQRGTFAKECFLAPLGAGGPGRHSNCTAQVTRRTNPFEAEAEGPPCDRSRLARAVETRATASMKKGFLLASPEHRSSSTVVEAVDSEECPICLEPLEPARSVLLPCRHLLCGACTRSLWQLRRESDASTTQLECPVCRSHLSVARGDLNAFIAAHCAANFGGDESTTTPSPRRVRQPMSLEGLDTLTVPELLATIRQLGIQSEVAGINERNEIERCIERALPEVPLGAQPVSAIGRLPIRCLRAILDVRRIPHSDLVYKVDLAALVVQSPRGSCMHLPARVLLHMLRDFGHGDEEHIEKSELARRVAAARLIAKANPQTAARAPARPSTTTPGVTIQRPVPAQRATNSDLPRRDAANGRSRADEPADNAAICCQCTIS